MFRNAFGMLSRFLVWCVCGDVVGVLVGCACSVLGFEEAFSFRRTVPCAKPDTMPLLDRFDFVV